mmetsp:Transcript_26016/g.75135  ORF Transcript_26016/g.75135 Transcript_26016/m.75135 type:complete len:233 (-) Transcript_26016:191-889(-)
MRRCTRGALTASRATRSTPPASKWPRARSAHPSGSAETSFRRTATPACPSTWTRRPGSRRPGRWAAWSTWTGPRSSTSASGTRSRPRPALRAPTPRAGRAAAWTGRWSACTCSGRRRGAPSCRESCSPSRARASRAARRRPRPCWGRARPRTPAASWPTSARAAWRTASGSSTSSRSASRASTRWASAAAATPSGAWAAGPRAAPAPWTRPWSCSAATASPWPSRTSSSTAT